MLNVDLLLFQCTSGMFHVITGQMNKCLIFLTYVILLSSKFLTEIKLLSLESLQPLPQLVGLLPKQTQKQ